VLRIARAPPVVGLALAAAAGAALNHLGVPVSWTLLSLILLLRPNAPSPRPTSAALPLTLAFLAGGLLTHQWDTQHSRDCRFQLRDESVLRVVGRLSGRVSEGRGELRVVSGLPVGCTPPLRFVLTAGATEEVAPGTLVSLRGRWRKGRVRPREDPKRAGYLRVEGMEVRGGGEGWSWDAARWRGWVQLRLERLFPNQGALVEALVLARKEGLTPEIRESFAVAGTAHLLAISGFHVGVVGGILLLMGGWLGLSHPNRFLLGSVGVWGYVLLIGMPDAALRAALILSILAFGRMSRRPVAPLGALSTAFLAFLFLDPGALLRPGFQLSFAGAFGLMVWGESMAGALRGSRLLRDHRLLASGLAAGISATLATLPLVVWHFGRVSLVGIPVTLLAAPLITLAIPGIFLSLLLSAALPPVGALLAQGVEVVLWVLTHLVVWAGQLPLASIWVSRPALLAGTAGVLAALFWHGHRPHRGLTRKGRTRRLLTGAAAGVLLWPVAEVVLARGTMEIVMLDVGQGDALVLRSPRGRWILVDTGPKTQSFDAGARTVLPYLRRRGVGEVAFLVLTHPDMDHVGGAEAVLEGIRVGQVLDPGRVVDTDVFFHALEAAEEEAIPWRVARAGDSLMVDGMVLRVLWPPGQDDQAATVDRGAFAEGTDDFGERHALAARGSNETSVVLEVRFGDFSLLLTGDASSEVEEAVLPFLASPHVQVLKVGHHGSSTSTSPELLERISPSMALISVGRKNRYGHPHSAVLDRLLAHGAEVLRTDEDGVVRIRARRDGRFQLR
jgi:competence protein ComEC